MKYVAFLDILGFKNKLKKMAQHDAKWFIGGFSSTVYSVFQRFNKEVNGFIVSDSVILHTNNVSVQALSELMKIVDEICKKEFSENGILIRGAIAKGEFDTIPATELPKLQKQLIVGQAYVDAYRLEGDLKNIGINLSQEVYQDFQNCNSDINILDERIKDTAHYVFRYLTIDFLLNEDNLRRFVELATESEWLPHYYNALYFAMKRETNDKKIEQVFSNIQNIIRGSEPGENWRKLDQFIKNAFVSEVIDDYQTRFLKHIRQRLV